MDGRKSSEAAVVIAMQIGFVDPAQAKTALMSITPLFEQDLFEPVSCSLLRGRLCFGKMV